jgi:hypothetical protein
MSEAAPAATGMELMELVVQMERAGAMTFTTLDLPANLEWDEYQAVGHWLHRIDESTPWWVGDWLLYGDGRYGEDVYQAASSTGFNQDTMRQWLWVAQQVPPKRRRADVTWSHHRQVAKLPAKEQTHWLVRAAREKWTVSELRRQMNPSDIEGNGGADPITRVNELIDLSEVAEVARAVIRDMRDAPDPGYMLVPVETMRRLVAALREET